MTILQKQHYTLLWAVSVHDSAFFIFSLAHLSSHKHAESMYIRKALYSWRAYCGLLAVPNGTWCDKRARRNMRRYFADYTLFRQSIGRGVYWAMLEALNSL